MGSSLYIGIDIGTSSVRCSAIDDDKQLVGISRTELPPSFSPNPGWYEQNAQVWYEATLKCLGDLLEHIDPMRVAAIAVDATSSTVLLVDAENNPQSFALMYNDLRAADIVQHLKSFVPLDNITLSASSSLAKAYWLLQTMPVTKKCHIVHQADWISGKLSGQTAISDENNSLKLGYDSTRRKWPEWFHDAPLDLFKKLPEVKPSGTVIGKISLTIARKLGVKESVKIVSGTTDSTASSLATGILNPGQAVTTFGTTLVMKIISESPVTSVKEGIYSHKLPNGLWLVGGASNSGGNVLLKYFSSEQIKDLSTQINTETDTGLDFYPLSEPGERFPVNDPHFLPRLMPRPKSDVVFLQAIFEGFARIEKLAYEKMASLGAPYPRAIITAGGQATENAALNQIRSRILGIPVLKADQTEASYGSALLALFAISGSLFK